MIFGYAWKDPRAISDKTQRQYLADAGANDRFLRTEKSPSRDWRRDLLYGDRELRKGEKPKPLLRPGDVIAVYRSRYLADDSLDFVECLCRLAGLGAGIRIINEDIELFPDSAMADLIRDDIAERRHKQTKPARDALATLPKSKRGGAPRTEDSWSDDKKKKFRKMWALPPAKCSQREIGREFEITAPAVKDIAKRMKLPPRGA